MNKEKQPGSENLNLRSQWGLRFRAIRNLPPILRIIWDSGRAVVAGSLALRIFGAMLPIAMLGISRYIIDGIVTVSRGEPRPEKFWWWVGMEFALACLGATLGRTISFLDGLIADRFSRYLSAKVMDHASRLDLASYEDAEFSDRLERARTQATDRLQMVRSIGEMIQQAAVAVGMCVSVLVSSPWLLILLVGCILPAFIGESYFAFLGYSLNFRQTPVRREIDYLRVLATSKESAKEMKLFGLGNYFNTRFQKLWAQLYQQNLTLARHRLVAGSLLSLVSAAGYYASYVWVVWRALQGQITIGTMTFLTGAIAGASSNLQSFFAKFAGVADEALFLTDLIAFFEQKPRIKMAKHPLRAPRPIRSGFRFENVSFQYPGSSKFVLRRVNLHLRPGERVALVGQNGQGKTTIVKLLARLYDPTEGRILLDGIDLREYDPASLAVEIAVIFQDFMRYDMTVRENIGLGQVDYLKTANHHLQIARAAEKSMAAPVIAGLPLGFDQMLGRRFEGGVDLSGGEWQKIALARAYLREAQVLILDEPSASLDAPSELELFERLSDLSEGRMALLISHRFSTVRMADRILVLHDGQITEQGTHNQLMDVSGKYAEMFTMQAASYR